MAGERAWRRLDQLVALPVKPWRSRRAGVAVGLVSV